MAGDNVYPPSYIASLVLYNTTHISFGFALIMFDFIGYYYLKTFRNGFTSLALYK